MAISFSPASVFWNKGMERIHSTDYRSTSFCAVPTPPYFNLCQPPHFHLGKLLFFFLLALLLTNIDSFLDLACQISLLCLKLSPVQLHAAPCPTAGPHSDCQPSFIRSDILPSSSQVRHVKPSGKKRHEDGQFFFFAKEKPRLNLSSRRSPSLSNHQNLSRRSPGQTSN